jgi:hypothetical protein
MTYTSRGRIGRKGKAVVAIAVLFAVIIAGSVLSLGADTKPTTCPLQSPQEVVQVSSAESLTFHGCLTPGESGYYPFAIVNQAGFNMSGSIKPQHPIQITIGGGSGCNLCMLYEKNDTTSATFFGLPLLPQTGYAISIWNVGGQNNTVTINLNLQ